MCIHQSNYEGITTSKLESRRSFSYSKKKSGSNDISLRFVEFSNVHNSDGSSNAAQSNLMYKMYEVIVRSRLFRRIAKRST